MNYLVSPTTLVFNSHRVNGYTEMVKNEKIHQWELLDIATEVAEEWTNDWPEDQGFGSSDMTYMIKDFIDNVITSVYMKNGMSSSMYMTKFTPSLSVVPYSEEEHHNKVQRMESGI